MNVDTVVWTIEASDLGPHLIAGDDANPGLNEHVSIGPSATMPYDEYVRSVEATQARWKAHQAVRFAWI
jgi:hypothetical protein